LRLNSQAGAVLLLCGDTVIGNSAFHTNCIPPFAVCMSAAYALDCLENAGAVQSDWLRRAVWQ
jgi:hypothetical protein